MILEITNPSDRYTIETDDWQTACVANLVLGQGQYGLQELDGNFQEAEEGHFMPIFIFGGSEEWAQEEFGIGIDELVDAERPGLADCLDSIVVGDRSNYLLTLGDKEGEEAEVFWLTWHEQHRSSTNNIGGYAKEIAAKLRIQEKLANE